MGGWLISHSEAQCPNSSNSSTSSTLARNLCKDVLDKKMIKCIDLPGKSSSTINEFIHKTDFSLEAPAFHVMKWFLLKFDMKCMKSEIPHKT